MKNRLFLAITLPEQTKKAILGIQQKLKRFDWPVRWEPPNKWHITLRWLGYITDSEIQRVQKIVARYIAAYEPLSVRIQDFIVLPSFALPRVICLNITGSQSLQDISSDINTAIDARGIGQPMRHLAASHITLGRMQPIRVNFRALTKLHFQHAFTANEIALVNSQTNPKQAVYSIIKTFTLL